MVLCLPELWVVAGVRRERRTRANRRGAQKEQTVEGLTDHTQEVHRVSRGSVGSMEGHSKRALGLGLVRRRLDTSNAIRHTRSSSFFNQRKPAKVISSALSWDSQDPPHIPDLQLKAFCPAVFANGWGDPKLQKCHREGVSHYCRLILSVPIKISVGRVPSQVTNRTHSKGKSSATEWP